MLVFGAVTGGAMGLRHLPDIPPAKSLLHTKLGQGAKASARSVQSHCAIHYWPEEWFCSFTCTHSCQYRSVKALHVSWLGDSLAWAWPIYPCYSETVFAQFLFLLHCFGVLSVGVHFLSWGTAVTKDFEENKASSSQAGLHWGVPMQLLVEP